MKIVKTQPWSFYLSLILFLAVVAGCGSGGDSGETDGATYTLSGQVEKGPFAIGSQVSINELDKNLSPTGKVYNVQTTDDLGNFAVSSKIGTNLVEIVGDGFYMDELTGNLAASRIQLRAVADLSVDATPTINILTSLQAQRLKKLITQGSTYTTANIQSQNEVLAAFGVDPTKINSLSTLYSMQINGTTDADSVLLATSAILSKMATNAAVANGTTQPAELSNYISTIAAQIASAGTITQAAITTAMDLAETQINLAAVRTNIETYYANRGVTIVAPKFEEWVDKDGSGILPRRLVPVIGLAFTDVSGVEPQQLITSNTITVGGLGAGIVAMVVANTGTAIIKNGAAMSSTSATAIDGDTIALLVTSLGYALFSSSTISVGSTSAVWRVTTKSLSGTISGLTSSGLVLQNNAGDNITLPAGSTSFSFPSGVAIGGSYSISVLSQPTNPRQMCAVSNGTGTVSSIATNITVACMWTATGSLVNGRGGNTATLLSTGKVLVVGGQGGNEVAELYDPATGIWTLTGNLVTGRNSYTHSTTLLANGEVLVVGGGSTNSLINAELYNPASGVWTATGSLITGRGSHTATLLPNGMVLVAGGFSGQTYLASAELYDPATGVWTATGSRINSGGSHTATLLPSGKVLVAGGQNSSSAELYDPATGVWTATGSLPNAHQEHTATLLPNGKVLVVGGAGGGGYSGKAELYDPANGGWIATGNLSTPRYATTATLLPNGKVLVAGGFNGSSLATAELYEPATGLWSATGNLVTGRYLHTATLLPNGKVLVAGEWASFSANTELYW